MSIRELPDARHLPPALRRILGSAGQLVPGLARVFGDAERRAVGVVCGPKKDPSAAIAMDRAHFPPRQVRLRNIPILARLVRRGKEPGTLLGADDDDGAAVGGGGAHGRLTSCCVGSWLLEKPRLRRKVASPLTRCRCEGKL